MGKSSCCEKDEVKKGPWTPEEDEKLVDYIQKHGAGKWRTLPKNAGLSRCGKSCRLRWMNYLRPDIKRGEFSLHEEETIIQLHRVLGNKWSAIATQLPGRTDNEIKNYWNTNIRKKLLRMGIDPVTHCPQINLLQLGSILNSSLCRPSLQPNIISNPFDPTFNSTSINPQILNLATTLLSNINQNPPQDNTEIDSYRYLQPNQPQTDLNPRFTIENQVTNDHQTDFTGWLSSQITSPAQWQNNVEYSNDYFPFTDTNNRTLAGNTSVCISNDDSENFTRWNFGSILSATPSSSSTPLNSSSTAYINGGGSEDERESYGTDMFMFDHHHHHHHNPNALNL